MKLLHSGVESAASPRSALLVHPRGVRHADDEPLAREHTRDGLAPRLLPRRVEKLEPRALELLGRSGDRFGAFDVELDARLRTCAIGRPVRAAEACLGRL